MGLEPQAPDTQAGASHSPVLCSSFPQSKSFWNLLSTPLPKHKVTARKVGVSLALCIGLFVSSRTHTSRRAVHKESVRSSAPQPTVPGTVLSWLKQTEQKA